jgi:hypothetical protein
MIDQFSDPERCREHCTSMQEWRAKPDDHSSTEGGMMQNADIVSLAERICPGVAILLEHGTPTHFLKHNPDGSYSLPAAAIKIYCRFDEANHGPDMGS